MSTELSGLELRKALCEALGWTLEFWHDAGPLTGKPRYWHSPACGPLPVNMGDRCVFECHLTAGESAANVLPAFESDPGVFWPEFEKWWKSVEWPGDGFVQGNNYSCGLGSCHWFDIYLRGQRFNYCGNAKATLLEAGCRAWLQALNHQDRAPQSAGSSNDSPQGRKSKSPSEKS